MEEDKACLEEIHFYTIILSLHSSCTADGLKKVMKFKLCTTAVENGCILCNSSSDFK